MLEGAAEAAEAGAVRDNGGMLPRAAVLVVAETVLKVLSPCEERFTAVLVVAAAAGAIGIPMAGLQI